MEKDQFKCPGKQFTIVNSILKFYVSKFCFYLKFSFLRIRIYSTNSRVTDNFIFEKFRFYILRAKSKFDPENYFFYGRL